MDIAAYEKWLIKNDNKTSGSAYSYKIALPHIEKHYSNIKGFKVNLFDLDINELQKIVEDYGLKGKYSEIGNKSNGTYRNALNALLRFKKEQPKKLNDIKSLIKEAIKLPYIQALINEQTYHFQKLLNIKDEFFNFEISAEKVKSILIEFNEMRDETFEYFVNKKEGIEREFLDVLGEYISYLDSKASGKQKWNKYSDKRSIAQSGVRQNFWVNNLLELKINPDVESTSSIKNAVGYSISPMDNLTVLSENHRKLISNSILKTPYEPNRFQPDLIKFFDEFNITAKNRMNYTYIISSILYDKEVNSIWNLKEPKNKNEKIEVKENIIYMNTPLNQILYGPPGTGKTYSTKELAVNIILGKRERTRDEILESFDELQKNKQITFTTFHQSISYEDFIEGIKPETVNENVTYEVKDGIFKQICELANVKKESNFDEAYLELLTEFNDTDNDYIVLKTPTNKEFRINLNSNNNLTIYTSKEINKQGVMTKSNLFKMLNGEDVFRGWEGYAKGVIDYLKTKHSLSINKKDVSKNYVLIIDEINRGNISSIFGELITLLEDDKRKGNKEEIEVILPYSKEKFSVPSNLYIIGTMNTADRSVEALDTALRRRFSFTEIQYNPNVIEFEHSTNGIVTFEGKDINLITLLNTINERIEILIDKDHKIGHSYFINTSTFDELISVFNNKVIPLLEEYFFGDFGKIGLVLGSAFIIPVENGNKVKFATNFQYDDKEMLREKSIYKFTDKTEWNAGSFISIYSEN